MKKIYSISIFAVLYVSEVFGSGLDLSLYHGTRYIGLGGQQIAIAKDAYAPFYNPAGMSWIEDSGDFALNVNNLVLQYEAPIGAANNQRKSEWTWGPLFYVGGAYKINDRFSAGLAIFPTALQGGKFSPVDFAPAGTTLEGMELSNRLVRIELAPSFAVKIVDHLSAGLSYRIAYTRYDKAGGYFYSVAGTNAIHLDSTLTGWDFDTLKAGLMLDDWNGLSVAATYRMRTKLNLSGETKVTTLDPTLNGTFHASQEVSIPAQMQLGVAYDWIPNRLMSAFTYEYTLNDVVKTDTMTTDYPAAALQTVSVPVYYKNGHTFHLGTEYVFDMPEQRKLRTGLGLAFDKTFTRSNFPSPVLAPSNWYLGGAVSAQYEVDRGIWGLSFNYGRYDKRTSNIDSNLGYSTFAGKYGLEVFLISADYQFKF